jgi:hypothetical protein
MGILLILRIFIISGEGKKVINEERVCRVFQLYVYVHVYYMWSCVHNYLSDKCMDF